MIHTKRFVKAYWALDKSLANARFFPAIQPLDSYSEYAADLAGWWNSLDPNWQRNRDEAMNLLLEADKLRQIVRIMGEDGLTNDQRKVLLADRLIREGFLQQSAFHPADRYASPAKQANLLARILHTIRAMLADPEPASRMSEKYQLPDLIRLKDEIPSERATEILGWGQDAPIPA